MILVTMLFVPVTVLLLNTSNILIFVGFNHEAALVSGEYTKYLIWGFYMDCMF